MAKGPSEHRVSPQPGWQRLAVAAILVIPLLALVLLSVPAWITWPFLAAERRATVLEFVDRIVELTKALTHIRLITGPAGPPQVLHIARSTDTPPTSIDH